MIARDVIMPIQKWLLSEGRCSSCGEALPGGAKTKGDSHIVVRCSCSRSFEYFPKENYFQKMFLTVPER